MSQTLKTQLQRACETVVMKVVGEVDRMFGLSAGLRQAGSQLWAVVVIVTAAAVVLRVFAYWMRNSIGAVHQTQCREILHAYDHMEVEEPKDALGGTRVREIDGESRRTRKPRADNSHWWVLYAVAAREQHSNPSDTPAMRRCIHKWISEKMKEDGVTMRDRTRFLGRAVEWTYVPNIGDVESKKDKRSRAVNERKVDYNRPWWSYWWGHTSTIDTE